MQSRARVTLLVAILVACTPARQPSPPPGLSRPSATTYPQPSQAVLEPRFFGPADFIDNELSFDVPPPSAGHSLLLFVPDVGVGSYRRGVEHERRVLKVRVAAALIAGSSPGIPGHPLPATIGVTPTPPLLFPSAATSVLPPSKRFRVHNGSGGYEDADGRLAYRGTHYAFYEDPVNRIRFSVDEYRRIDQVASRDWERLVSIFGEPSDMDHNARILVFVSTTAVAHEKGQGMVDACNLDPGAPSCGGLGELIRTWSLDGFPDATDNRAFYVEQYFPRLLLHETIHLCQQRIAIQNSVHPDELRVPAYLREGQAMLMRFLNPDGGTDWRQITLLVDRHGPQDDPFSRPYELGGLLAFWMNQRWGPGIQRALIAAENTTGLQDPIETATGVPEPLLLAEFSAALLLDGSEYGRRFNLDFGDAHVSEHLRTRPPARVWPYAHDEERLEVHATNYGLIEIAHDAAVRVHVVTSAEKAYVLLL